MRARAALLVVVALTTFLLALFPLNCDDVGFHVTTGRLVRQAWREGRPIPTRNPCSYADPDAPWVQHQHLSAVAISWLIDDAPRLLGLHNGSDVDVKDHPDARVLVVLKALLYMLLFLLIAAALFSAAPGLPAPLAGALLLHGVVASCNRFFERPFVISLLCLAVVSLAWRRHLRSGRRGWLVLAVVAPVLSAHLHAGVLDALLYWLAEVAGAAMARATGKDSSALRQRLLGFAVLLLLLFGSLALLSPSGVRGLLLPLAFSANGYFALHLAEFRPLLAQGLYLWPAILYVALLAALVLWQRRRLRGADLLIALGFALLALRHQRMVLPMVVATLPVLGAAAGHAFQSLRPAGWPRPALRSLALVLCAAWPLLGARDQAQRYPMGLGPAGGGGISPAGHPFALLGRIDHDRLPGEVFTSDAFAGTFLWRFFPERKVLVHDAIEAYHEATFTDPYQIIRYAEPGFEERLRRLGIRTFLLKHSTARERSLQGGRPNLRDVLFARSGSGRFPDAVLIDYDDSAALWVLREALPAGVAALDGFPVNPDSGQLRPGVSGAAVAEALQRHAAAHPGGQRDALLRQALRGLGAQSF